jgi:dipeptidyl aminopeptidase/acylaminoacyl peptidase
MAMLASAPLLGAGLISIEDFARERNVRDLSISPDGRYLAVVSSIDGAHVALVLDRRLGLNSEWKGILKDKEDHAQLTWCRFANATRLLCKFRGTVNDAGVIYNFTRLVAVDTDGKNQLVLLQNNSVATGVYQDHVVDWHPGKADTILIEADEMDAGALHAMTYGGGYIGKGSSGGYPAVFELNVVTGKSKVLAHAHPPIFHYMSDGHGNLRFGWGLLERSKTYQYYVRSTGTNSWRTLLKYDAFSAESTKVLTPVAISPDDPNRAYARGLADDRDALWSIDLNDKNAPSMVFQHPSVDISDANFAKDGRLLGVAYETDRPFMYYTDSRASSIASAVKAVLPNQYIGIADYTADEKIYLIFAASDVDAGTYYLYDTEHSQLGRISRIYPEIDPEKLPRMRSISYPAKDGTSIPGYLTVPVGLRAEKLPLIIMPHGGPIHRDSWDYDFLRHFLANRGYAVLQMNYRGSSGYGSKWFYDAHQDWGGLTYSDIVDGAHWAVKEGIADPEHMCIVGWSFGGYAALLGATRDSKLYRCAVSIAGVSDLALLERQGSSFMGSAVSREQIGTNSAKLREDSPRRHAENVGVPILMVHGDLDPQVNLNESEAMARALKKAGKPYELIVLKGADHQIEREKDRAVLLTAVEKFLATNLGPGAVAAH